ncbi:MAG: PLP-dependent cysteine synthase family protein [Pseudomonadota bacterium]
MPDPNEPLEIASAAQPDEQQLISRAGPRARIWTAWATTVMGDPAHRPVDPPLIAIPCPELPGIDIYLKDETRHPTGSLKHRLAHALFLHTLCNGYLSEGTIVIEASSGSTAISEAWFAAKLGLRFIAVVPNGTAPAKVAAIEHLGGEIVFAGAGGDISNVARRIAAETGGYFMDQFTHAAEATDWRGANNIADALFSQMRGVEHPVPSWIVVGAGTGGTSATIGRYIRLKPELAATRLCVVDPDGSAFFRAYASGDWSRTGCTSRVVEGIGRKKVEPSFIPALVDQMVSVTDAGSVAGALWLKRRIGRAFGPSTGTNIIGALMLAQAMARRGERGSIVTLGCDDGERYRSTIYDYAWLAEAEIDVGPWLDLLERFGRSGFPEAMVPDAGLMH